jgi:cytochrome c peroxidase
MSLGVLDIGLANRTTGSYPGSVRTGFSERKPQTRTYAPHAPVLHYNEGQDDLVGGNLALV